MISKVIDWCTHNAIFVLIIAAFALIGGISSIRQVPLDAIPDLSDTQVIVFSRWMRSPDIIEDQVTYPIVSALLGAPKVKAIRAFSDFGFSYVYVIFQDGTDVYWARSRVLEYLSKVQGTLPAGVKTELGPDATGVGWVYQYALVDKTGKNDLMQLRSYQDWYLKYALQAIPGVAEVASVGGFVKQYEVQVNPAALQAYKLPLPMVMMAIRQSNNEVGGRLLDIQGTEFMVRGKGYVKSTRDLEQVVVMNDPTTGTPVYLRDVANIRLAPDIRRGIVDLNGEGEVVGGIVTMRYGENALNLIERVKEKLAEIKPQLPKGVEVVPVYDRSELIHASIGTLREELIKLTVAVSLVCLLFLFHLPSALVVILTLPIAIILSFIPMQFLGVTSNIMSLGGIAIAIGAMVDAAIIMVENAHKKLEERELAISHQSSGMGSREQDRGRIEAILDGAKEVGPSLFFALLVITVSFLPIFSLEAQEGRLFRPLAFTKTFAMFFASLLAVTITPILMTWLIRGKIPHEDKNPVSHFLRRIYEPVAHFVLKYPKRVIASAALLVVLTIPVALRLGSEFMPPLWEGSLLYMPTTLPGISVTEAGKLLQTQDKILKSFPEVDRVFGKVGRADTSLDPAPFSMAETTVLLKPERDWRKGMTVEKLTEEMDTKLRFPGVSNAWVMPIKNRIDMLSTGIRTPIGIKVLGKDVTVIEKVGVHIQEALRNVRGTRSVFAERAAGGYYIDFDIDREAIARHGLTIDDVQMVIMSGIGGETISDTVEGRERYSIAIRYPRELRDSPKKLERVLVATKSGAQIPIGELAKIELRSAPGMIRDENGLLASYVFVDLAGRDPGSYVREAKKVIQKNVQIPAGYELVWSGQFEYMERAAARLKIMVPLTLLIVLMLIYFNTKSWVSTGIVLLAVPFSLVGAFWLLWILGYNMSVAVWVGLIALAGLDAETGVIMLLYLDLAYKKWKEEGRLKSMADLEEAILHGAVKRIRPKVMTVSVILAGLIPILWSHGAGADVMKRIAAPMIGGVVTSLILELLVYPAIYKIWKGREISVLSR